jgi:hypothetical protein
MPLSQGTTVPSIEETTASIQGNCGGIRTNSKTAYATAPHGTTEGLERRSRLVQRPPRPRGCVLGNSAPGREVWLRRLDQEVGQVAILPPPLVPRFGSLASALLLSSVLPVTLRLPRRSAASPPRRVPRCDTGAHQTIDTKGAGYTVGRSARPRRGWALGCVDQHSLEGAKLNRPGWSTAGPRDVVFPATRAADRRPVCSGLSESWTWVPSSAG